MSDLVECHSGFTYADRPKALIWQGIRRDIAEVLHSWHVPAGKQFRVRCTDGSVFLLTFTVIDGEWQIEPFSLLNSDAEQSGLSQVKN